MTDTTLPPCQINDPWDHFMMEQVPDFDGDYCHTTVTDSGHIQMMSDTLNNEFILTNHASGTYIMMLPCGKLQANTVGDHVQLVIKNNKIWIKGSSLVHVDGNANINVGENAYIGVDGSLTTHVKGSVDISSDTSISLNAPQVNVVTTNGMTVQGSQIHFPGDVTIHGDLEVQQSCTVQQNIKVMSSLFAQCGMMTPGSLVVGPLAWTTPLPSLVTNFVTIQCALPVLIDSALTVDIASGGATTINSGAAIEIAAGGLLDIAAAGAVAIEGSSVSILPDVQIGDVVSFLSHIHYGVSPGPDATSAPFPGS
jgi:hypothetical protein